VTEPDGAPRVCLVGKYPPIQGGISGQTYVAAQLLASRGHRVDVVTNAREVEPGFRQLVLPADERRLAAPAPPGAVRVHATQELPEGAYVPWANPYLSKLLGLTLAAAEEASSDALVGWYLEPYGVVAAMAGRITGLPVMLIHAGSDVGRLAEHPDLAGAYRWAIASSDRIQTDPRVILRLTALGAEPDQFVFPGASRLPAFFWEEAPALDVREWWPAALERYRQLADTGAGPQPPGQVVSLDPGVPTVGVYGKVAEAKGSFDLLAVLSRLAAAGARFNLLAAVGGQARDLSRFLDRVWSDNDLRERSVVLPFLPPWRVPELLAACDVACCLERRFPISFHSSRVPIEIATSGTCLVCSSEVVAPHAGDGAFAHGETCIEVKDPVDHDELAHALGWALDNLDEARAIGARARSVERDLQASFPSESSIADAIADWLGERVSARA
jgi:glycosyltransferase involved in cell wall biosynthesis